MAKIFIIVDDKKPDRVSISYNLGATIQRLTNGAYKAEICAPVIISQAIDPVKQVVQSINTKKNDDLVIGVLVDLVEPGNVEAGRELLVQIKRDQDLRELDVVIYTSTAVEIEYEEMRRIGAKEVVQRDFKSGLRAHIQLASEVLDAFGINYKLSKRDKGRNR